MVFLSNQQIMLKLLTVIAYPGEITSVKDKFDIAGLYVWHCHIVEHEDNEMMRPFVVSPP